MMQFDSWSYTDLFVLRYGQANPGGKPPVETRNVWNVKERFLADATVGAPDIDLYLHIPFCVRRCTYCQWNAVAYQRSAVNRYVAALCAELRRLADAPKMSAVVVRNVYLGGGTPSVLSPEDITLIFRELARFQVAADAEISFEANPATLSPEKMDRLQGVGVNRLSFGVQSFSDPVLARLECTHRNEQTLQVLAAASARGFAVNVDLLYGLSGQTLQEWATELDLLMAQAPDFATLYPLRVFPGSILDRGLSEQGFDRHTHEAALADYERLATERLHAAGYAKGEFPYIFARAGERPLRYVAVESRVVGVGASGGSYLDSGESRNLYDPDAYCAAVAAGDLPIAYELGMTQRQVRERFVFHRLVYSDRTHPEFYQRLAQAHENMYGEPLDDELYAAVVADLRRYRLLSPELGIPTPTDELWRMFDNYTILY